MIHIFLFKYSYHFAYYPNDDMTMVDLDDKLQQIWQLWMLLYLAHSAGVIKLNNGV
jgi:hypothetical protein